MAFHTFDLVPKSHYKWVYEFSSKPQLEWKMLNIIISNYITHFYHIFLIISSSTDNSDTSWTVPQILDSKRLNYEKSFKNFICTTKTKRGFYTIGVQEPLPKQQSLLLFFNTSTSYVNLFCQNFIDTKKLGTKSIKQKKQISI